MVDHLSRDVLARYAARTLSAREILRADKHLASCSACRTELVSQAVGTASARRVVRAVERAAEHLSYEQLEAYVDQRLTADGRAKVDRHIERCARCARELAEMRTFAPALAAPVARADLSTADPAAPGAPRGLLAALAAWFGPMPVMRIAAAVLVAAVGITLVMQGGDQRTSPHVDFALSRDALDLTSSAPTKNTFDQSVFAALAGASPDLGAAFRAGDFPKVAAELKAKAEEGDPAAQTGLALMYLAGEGVVRDVAQAESLLRSAADKGAAPAAHNLGVLNASGLLGYTDEEQARRWFAEAEELRKR